MYFKEKILKVVKLLQEDFKQNIKENDMDYEEPVSDFG